MNCTEPKRSTTVLVGCDLNTRGLCCVLCLCTLRQNLVVHDDGDGDGRGGGGGGDGDGDIL